MRRWREVPLQRIRQETLQHFTFDAAPRFRYHEVGDSQGSCICLLILRHKFRETVPLNPSPKTLMLERPLTPHLLRSCFHDATRTRKRTR